MNTDRDLERQITGVFASEVPSGYPEELLGRVLTTTSRTRPRPTWLADIKEPPMRIPARVVVGSPTLRLVFILALTLALALALGGAVVAGASLLPSQAPAVPDPFGPARNGSMIYEHAGDIYLADPDGGNPRAIITGDERDWSPWFSHDGRTIAFARGNEPSYALMLAEADGSNVRQVLEPTEWNVEYMPDDMEMVATRMVDGHRLLSMIDIATGSIRNLDVGALDPNYFQMPRPPDGQEIIFKAHTTQGGTQNGLYAIKPDGTGLRTIGEPSTTIDADLSFQDPVLSPDGSTIAFWNWEPKDATTTSSDSYLHMRDLATGEELPLPFATEGHVGVYPHFSPDGTMVVYEANAGGIQQLYYGSVDGSVQGRFIGPRYSYMTRNGFDFTPDGKHVILSLAGKTLSVDVATGESTELADIPTLPYWQRLAP